MIHHTINNKDLFIADNFFPKEYHERFYTYCSKLPYYIGYPDTMAYERLAHQYYHTSLGVNELQEIDLFNYLYKTEFADKIKNRQLVKATINSSTASQANFPHCDRKSFTMIYYMNLDWKPEWAGETVFFNENTTEIELASIYKPNRAILFDGHIPHQLRPQSILSPNFRFSLAMFFEK